MTGTEQGAVAERDKFISTAVVLSDEKCALHKAAILANTSVWNVGTGASSILFAGTASVLSHAKTVADLSAAAAATSGIQSLVNKEVYADAMGTTIIRAIEVARAKKRAPIISGLGDKDYSAYKALVDLRAYHDACSLMAGLTEVTKALDNREPSQNELQTSKKQLQRALEDLNRLDANKSGMSVAQLQEKKKALVEQIQVRTLAIAASKVND